MLIHPGKVAVLLLMLYLLAAAPDVASNIFFCGESGRRQ